MSDIEETINRLLGDPEQMQKISRLASSLMGGESAAASAAPVSGGNTDDAIDPAMLARISKLMGTGGAGSTDKRALLEAMKPYLSEKRRKKMDRALKIAQLAKVAKLAMGEMGEDGGV